MMLKKRRLTIGMEWVRIDVRKELTSAAQHRHFTLAVKTNKKEKKSCELAHKRPKLNNIGTSARRRGEDKYIDVRKELTSAAEHRHLTLAAR